MNALAISLLMALLALMNNPSIPQEIKVEIYNQAMPIIYKAMDEVEKPNPEIGEATSTEAVTPSVGAPEPQGEAKATITEGTIVSTPKTSRGTLVNP